MSIHRYVSYNGPMPTTGAQQSVAVASGTKTMLQLSTPTSRMLQVISWGFSLSGPLAGTIDLVDQDVADTVVAHTATGLYKIDPNIPASLLTLGTANTGYSASAQGSPTVSRVFDSQQIGATAGDNELNYSYQFLPDEQPIVNISRFLKVRATFAATTINMQCYIEWAE
jgi:hypothetical protein